MKPKDVQAVLTHFHLSEADFLGSGSESRVYQLDHEHILRVHSPMTSSEGLQRLHRFYRQIKREGVPFDLPSVIETGQQAGFYYTIEPRLIGSDLTTYLNQVDTKARDQAIEHYIQTAVYIQNISYPADFFGEILVSTPIRAADWPAYLKKSARKGIQTDAIDVETYVPHVERVFATWVDQLRSMEVPKPTLVHGDYFPGNVLVDPQGQVTAVIDFSGMTVLGDWRLDVVCALLFLELTPGYQPADTAVGKPVVDEILGFDCTQLLTIYRLYYSFYFLFATNDPPLHRWCVANINQQANR